MVEIPTYRNRRQATAQQNRFDIPTDTGNIFDEVINLVDDSLNKSIKEKGIADGIKLQKNSKDGTLVEQEGFLGFKGLRSQSVEYGAVQQFRVEKEGEARLSIQQLEADNILNPEGFKEGFDEFSMKFIDTIPEHLQPQFQELIETSANKSNLRITREKLVVDRNEQHNSIVRSADQDLDNIEILIEQFGADPKDPDVADNLFDLQAARAEKLKNLFDAQLINRDEYERQTAADKKMYLFYDLVAEAERLKQSGGDVKAFILSLDNQNTTPKALKGLTRSERESFQAKINSWFEDESAAARSDIAKVNRQAKQIIKQIYKGYSPANLDEIQNTAEEISPEAAKQINTALRNYSKSVDFNKSGLIEKIKIQRKLSERIKTATSDEIEQLTPLLKYYEESVKQHTEAVSKRNGLGYADEAGVFKVPEDFNITKPETFDSYVDAVNSAQDRFGRIITIGEGDNQITSRQKDRKLGLITHPLVKNQIQKIYTNGNIDKKLEVVSNVAKLVEMQHGDLDQTLLDLGIESAAERQAFYLMRGDNKTHEEESVAKKLLQGSANAKYEVIKNQEYMKRIINDQVQKIIPIMTDGISIDQDGVLAKDARDSIVAIMISNRINRNADIDSFDDDVTKEEIQNALAQYNGLNNFDDFPEFNDVITPPIKFGIGGVEWEDQFQSFSDEKIFLATNGTDLVDGTGKQIPNDRIREEGIPFPINDDGDFVILMKDPSGFYFPISESYRGKANGEMIFKYSDVGISEENVISELSKNSNVFFKENDDRTFTVKDINTDETITFPDKQSFLDFSNIENIEDPKQFKQAMERLTEGFPYSDSTLNPILKWIRKRIDKDSDKEQIFNDIMMSIGIRG